ncbi:hypothetical protein POTOM_028342 [Populus tomentosa]|uniref:alanine--tRNA ligase n=1 Tax=Populus tomentosa TaxID=118781 RepID=A0A8X7ZEA4_POPTO|nr:hypothetical protein POTOM_028342 [Populus tomentosa]
MYINMRVLLGIEKFKKVAQGVQGKVSSGQTSTCLYSSHFHYALINDAIVLWDTYGFPLYQMRQGKDQEMPNISKLVVLLSLNADATSALHKKDHESEIKAIYTGSEFWESASSVGGGIVLESTSFYSEQGPFGSFQVCDVQIFGGFILHISSITRESGRFSVGDKVICKVDYDRRKLITPTHTCTHMLNFALREKLDNYVEQKGSIVLLEKLRFDFSHGKSVDPELLRKIESIVNGKAQKKITEENTQKAIKFAVEMAEVAFSNGKGFCISYVDVGLDAAVLKVLEHKVVSLFRFFM